MNILCYLFVCGFSFFICGKASAGFSCFITQVNGGAVVAPNLGSSANFIGAMQLNCIRTGGELLVSNLTMPYKITLNTGSSFSGTRRAKLGTANEYVKYTVTPAPAPAASPVCPAQNTFRDWSDIQGQQLEFANGSATASIKWQYCVSVQRCFLIGGANCNTQLVLSAGNYLDTPFFYAEYGPGLAGVTAESPLLFSVFVNQYCGVKSNNSILYFNYTSFSTTDVSSISDVTVECNEPQANSAVVSVETSNGTNVGVLQGLQYSVGLRVAGTANTPTATLVVNSVTGNIFTSPATTHLELIGKMRSGQAGQCSSQIGICNSVDPILVKIVY